MKQERAQRPEKKTETPATEEPKVADTSERDALLDEIDTALEGIDQALATNFIQKGGQ